MHYVHLGHAGLVLNFRWGEIADFFLGWATIDFAHDDGRKFGKWSGQERGAEAEAMAMGWRPGAVARD